jgi:hypothetical protein
MIEIATAIPPRIPDGPVLHTPHRRLWQLAWPSEQVGWHDDKDST